MRWMRGENEREDDDDDNDDEKDNGCINESRYAVEEMM